MPSEKVTRVPTTRPQRNMSGQTMGSKGLKTRRKLIDTTVMLIERGPLRDIKVVDIATAAQTSTATFYLYFDTVIDVVLAAAAELSQSTPALLDLFATPWDAGSSDARALAFVRGYVGFWDAHRALLRTRNLSAEEGDIRFVSMRENAVRPLLFAMSKQVERAQEQALVPRSIRAYATCGTLLMMLERLGALSHLYHDSADVTWEQLMRSAAHMVSTAMGYPLHDDAAVA